MMTDGQPEPGRVFDLSTRTKLRVTGADRLRYLNGQITNDLRKASEASAIHACVLTAKGKINADVFLVAAGDSVLLDTDREMREGLAARLERYIIADDVQLEDVSDDFALFHVIGASGSFAEMPVKPVTADRFGCKGTDFWVKRDAHGMTLQRLAAQFSICDEACAENLRIERGIPRWGRELTDEIIPTEANLEESAIDYAKGCYIGQEVISRIKMSGQTNKRLCGLVATPDREITPGARLVTPAPEGKEVGWVTSATTSPRLGRQIALGFVKRGYQAKGTRLEARPVDTASASPTAAVEIVALPFV